MPVAREVQLTPEQRELLRRAAMQGQIWEESSEEERRALVEGEIRIVVPIPPEGLPPIPLEKQAMPRLEGLMSTPLVEESVLLQPIGQRRPSLQPVLEQELSITSQAKEQAQEGGGHGDKPPSPPSPAGLPLSEELLPAEPSRRGVLEQEPSITRQAEAQPPGAGGGSGNIPPSGPGAGPPTTPSPEDRSKIREVAMRIVQGDINLDEISELSQRFGTELTAMVQRTISFYNSPALRRLQESNRYYDPSPARIIRDGD
jgi:hypothetical protein